MQSVVGGFARPVFLPYFYYIIYVIEALCYELDYAFKRAWIYFARHVGDDESQVVCASSRFCFEFAMPCFLFSPVYNSIKSTNQG